MRKDGEVTRKKIMDSANHLIMCSGFGGTTVDEVIARAGITKGAFFYHFKSKEDLALELIKRHALEDRTMLDAAFESAAAATPDPASQLLHVIDFYIDAMSKEGAIPTGCLYASYCYEAGLLEDVTLAPVKEMVLHWRRRFLDLLHRAVAQTPPRLKVDLESLADQALVAFEGGFVLARTLEDPGILLQQLRHLRAYFSLLFAKEAA